MLEPNYEGEIAAQLDQWEKSASVVLWEAICDAIDLACDDPTSSAARRDRLVTATGTSVWRVPIRGGMDQNWGLLWWPNADGVTADIFYIGPC